MNFKVIHRLEDFNVRGEKIQIKAKVAVCAHCGTDLCEPDLEDENMLKAYRIYAEKHKLLLPEDIKTARERLGLSQSEFAKLIGISETSLKMYEAGALVPEVVSDRIKRIVGFQQDSNLGGR